MKFPVYRFSDVLRALRNEADLTVLRAAEVTQYGNYERWESGQTRVGPDHLENIAVAFGVGEDLWLLVYAWLVDRLTPLPGEEPCEVVGGDIRRYLDALPKGEVDLGEHSVFALKSLSHRDLALVALVARYGRGHAGDDRSFILSPRERAEVPSSPPPGSSLLGCLYGDVFRDVGFFVARTFMRAGLNALRPSVRRQVQRQSLLLFSEPEYLGGLLAAGAPPPGRRLRGFSRLARVAARKAPRVQELAGRQLEQVRREEEDARGEPVTLDEVRGMIRKVARDDRLWDASVPDAAPAADLAARATQDTELDAQVRALHDEVDRAARRALSEELEDAHATAEPASTFDAIRVLEPDASER